MEASGNFVVYDELQRPAWQTNTNQPNSYLEIQNDGELVVYNQERIPLWKSKTGVPGVAPYTLILQDDGNLVLYDSRN